MVHLYVLLLVAVVVALEYVLKGWGEILKIDRYTKRRISEYRQGEGGFFRCAECSSFILLQKVYRLPGLYDPMVSPDLRALHIYSNLKVEKTGNKIEQL